MSMQDKEVYENFIKGSIVATLTLGGTLGALILASLFLQIEGLPSFPGDFISLHAHFQLFGWLGLFIMGIAYHVIPRFKASQLHSKRLAEASFWLVAAGLTIRFIQVINTEAGGLMLPLAGILQSLGTVIFAYVIFKTIQASEQAREPFEGFVYAALSWFVIGSLVNLISSLMPTTPFKEALIHVMLYGFATNMIMAVGVRTLPVFLGLKSVKEKYVNYVLLGFNGGVVLRFAALTGLMASLNPLATVIEVVFLVTFIYVINIYAKPEIELPPMEASKNLERSVKGAYIWLLLALLLDLYNTFVGGDFYTRGAYLHALSVGFISMMIFGYATRIIPIFRGVDLHSLKLADTALILLVGGNIIRVGSELFHSLIPLLNPLLGISGIITLSAYAVFGYNIWQTMVKPYEED